MNFTQKTMEDCTYLIYKVGADEKVDDLAFKMLSNNNIDGVFKMNREDDDGVESFYIDVTSKISLAMFLDKPIKKDFFLGVLESIVKSASEADEYMLDPKYFLYDFENIYVDLSSKTATLIYLPVEREEKDMDVREFLKNMMFGVCYDLNEDCNYVARLINIINSKQAVTMDRLINVIDDIKKQGDRRSAMAPVQPSNSGVTPAMPSTPAQPVQQPVAGNQPNYVSLSQPAQPVQPATPVQPYTPAVNSDTPNKTDNNGGKKGGLFGGLFGSKQNATPAAPATPSGRPMPPMPSAPSAPVAPAPKKSSGLFGSSNDSKKAPAVPGGMNIPGQPSAPKISVPSSSGIQTPSGVNIPGRGAQPMPTPTPAPAPQQPAQPQGGYQPAAAVMGAAVPADDSFGRTVIIGGSAQEGRTVMINGSSGGPAVAKITRVKTNETANITMDVFKIGKEKDFVDFCIRDNNTISRLHAQIEKIDGQYYIKDINSLNHTYIGNDMSPLQSNKPYQLRNGIHFTLSDEEFIFTLR